MSMTIVGKVGSYTEVRLNKNNGKMPVQLRGQFRIGRCQMVKEFLSEEEAVTIVTIWRNDCGIRADMKEIS